jgi:hypothetical protein
VTGLADVLAMVSKSTEPGERGLREALSTLCLEKYDVCCKNAAVNAILEEHEGTLWRIAVPRVRQIQTANPVTTNGNSHMATASLVPAEKAKQSSSSLFHDLQPGFTFIVAPQSTALSAKPGPVAVTTKFRPLYVATVEEFYGQQLMYHSICMMAEYASYSFEELRMENYGYVLPEPNPTPVQGLFGSQTPKTNGNLFGNSTGGAFSFGRPAIGMFGNSNGGSGGSQPASASGGGLFGTSTGGFGAGPTGTPKSLRALGIIPKPTHMPVAPFGNDTPGQDKSLLSSAPSSVSRPAMGPVEQSPVAPAVSTHLQSAATAFSPGQTPAPK